MSRNVASATAVDLPDLVTGMPPVPPPGLDPYLDAVANCFCLYGGKHTTVPDIARQMGVSRATVYRNIGTVDSAARHLVVRELNRVLGEIAVRLGGRDPGPDEAIEVLVWLAEFAAGHPVLRRVLETDAEMLGPFMTEHFGELLERASDTVEPLLVASMASGKIAQRDPGALAEWLVRLMISVVLAPPRSGVRTFLDEVVKPILVPREGARG